MNKNIKSIALLGFSALLMLSVVSCAKNKQTIVNDIKDLGAKAQELESYVGGLQTSEQEVQTVIATSNEAVLTQFNNAIQVALNELITANVEDKIADLKAQSTQESSTADSTINDLAKQAALQAQNEYVQTNDLDALEQQIKDLEQQARDAVRSNAVSAVKSQLATCVSQEDSAFASFKDMAASNLKALEDNKGQASGKYISATDRDAVVNYKVDGIVLDALAKLVEADKSAVIDKVKGDFAYLTEELTQRQEEFQATVATRLNARLEDIDAMRANIASCMQNYGTTAQTLSDGIKEIEATSDKEEKKALIEKYDSTYKDAINTFAETRTNLEGLRVDSGNAFLENIVDRVIKDAITDTALDMIKENITTQTQEYLSQAQGVADKNEIASNTASALDVAIVGQIGNIETNLKGRVPALTKALKDLRSYRNNIATRIGIIKDFDDTQMQSLEKGQIVDEFNELHDVEAFKLAKYEVTYNLWYDVYQWGLANGYSFEGKGNQGSAFDTEGIAPTLRGKYQPVTNVLANDAVVWCNAYSEKSGKVPVYTIEGIPVKDSSFSSYDVAVNSSADGYRLPTQAELLYAGAFIPKDKHTVDGKSSYGWTWYNSDCGTHNVATKKAVKTVYKTYEEATKNDEFVGYKVTAKKASGVEFYDLLGNASELATNDTTSVDATAINGSWARTSNGDVYPYTYFHSFMQTVYVPNAEGLRVAQF